MMVVFDFFIAYNSDERSGATEAERSATVTFTSFLARRCNVSLPNLAKSVFQFS